MKFSLITHWILGKRRGRVVRHGDIINKLFVSLKPKFSIPTFTTRHFHQTQLVWHGYPQRKLGKMPIYRYWMFIFCYWFRPLCPLRSFVISHPIRLNVHVHINLLSRQDIARKHRTNQRKPALLHWIFMHIATHCIVPTCRQTMCIYFVLYSSS